MVDVSRLQEELEFITRNQAHHKQSDWFTEFPDNACNTSGCLAGWTVMHHAKDQLDARRSETWLDFKYVPVISYQPKDRSWSDLGADLLDLEYDQAHELFEGDNSLWDLWNLANIITEGRIEIPEEVEALRQDIDNRTEGEDYSWLVSCD